MWSSIALIVPEASPRWDRVIAVLAASEVARAASARTEQRVEFHARHLPAILDRYCADYPVR